MAPLCLLAFVGTAAAFAPAAPRAVSTRANAAMSQSLPFLKCPEKLDGSMVGDVGFDPLRYARSAELKHGRIAMLATVGFLVEEKFHLPGADYAEPNPLKAIFTVPTAANLQIFLLIACVELATLEKTYGDDAGNLGFDPLNFSKGKSAAEMKDLQLKELKNGRLAMMAFMGMAIQTLLFDQPL